jgi:hypothetical protein
MRRASRSFSRWSPSPPRARLSRAVEIPNAGLCDHCQHSRRVGAARGSVFRLCLLHERDARFAKYPGLPVLECSGYEKKLSEPAP